jgi:methylated-DNA-[protein]-cysteine S-methyltransferase
MTTAFQVFDTAIGRCAIAWGPQGIVGLALPEGDDDALRARVLRDLPTARSEAAPPDVDAAVAGIRALLAGQARDLSAVTLDMSRIPDFDRRVYLETRAIPPGDTLTYGEIADRLGDRGLSRAVGQALGRNPFPIIVPCHRVVAADGRPGGFSAPGGVTTKQRLLEIEGARALHPMLPWDRPGWRP